MNKARKILIYSLVFSFDFLCFPELYKLLNFPCLKKHQEISSNKNFGLIQYELIFSYFYSFFIEIIMKL